MATRRVFGHDQRLGQGRGEHHLGHGVEAGQAVGLVGPVAPAPGGGLRRHLRHHPVGRRAHQHLVVALGLRLQPGEVLGPLEAPPAGPPLRRGVAVQGGDQVDHELGHAVVPSSTGAPPMVPPEPAPGVFPVTGGGTPTESTDTGDMEVQRALRRLTVGVEPQAATRLDPSLCSYAVLAVHRLAGRPRRLLRLRGRRTQHPGIPRVPAGAGRLPAPARAQSTSAPVVVMIPGGGWRGADPTGLEPLAAALAAQGVVAMPVAIRAAGDGVVYPAPVEDVLCALADGAATAPAAGIRPTRARAARPLLGCPPRRPATLDPDELHARGATTRSWRPTPSSGWPGPTTSATSRTPRPALFRRGRRRRRPGTPPTRCSSPTAAPTCRCCCCTATPTSRAGAVQQDFAAALRAGGPPDDPDRPARREPRSRSTRRRSRPPRRRSGSRDRAARD